MKNERGADSGLLGAIVVVDDAAAAAVIVVGGGAEVVVVVDMLSMLFNLDT